MSQSGKILFIHFDSVANLYFWQAEDQPSLILILILPWKLGSSYAKQCFPMRKMSLFTFIWTTYVDAKSSSALAHWMELASWKDWNNFKI